MSKRIYVNVSSLNYWWGIYNLDYKVDYEDITIYNYLGKEFNKICRTCICTSDYLQSCLEEDDSEKDFNDEIKQFLKYKKVAYKYWYDDSRNDDFYEVPFEAKRNELGIKPSYIEIWHPNSVIDEQVIKECVVLFCEDLKDFN